MKNDGLSRLVKNTGILTIGSFSSKVLVFLLVPIYTGILSTEDYGLYDLSITTIQLLMPILTINIIDSILRFSMDKDNNISIVRRIAFSHIRISFVIFIIGILLCQGLRIFPQYKDYYFFIGAYFIAYTLNAYYLQVSKGCNHIKTIAIAGVLGTLVLTVSCIYFLKFTSLGLKGFYISNILGQGIPVIYYAIALKNENKGEQKKYDTELAKRMRKYSIPLILTAIGWWVNSSSDKYVVTLICGVAANGLLSISYKIPNILSVLSGIFNQAWQISAIEEYKGNEKNEYYNNVVISIMIATTLSGMVIILFNRPLSRLLFAKDFYEAWKFVPMLIVSSVFNVGSGLLAPILAAQYKTKPIAMSSLVGLLANVILNILLCQLWGIQGVTVATAISSFMICAIRYYAAREFFDTRMVLKVIFTIGATCILSVCEIFNISYIAMTIVILIAILVLYKELYLMKNKLFSKLRRR